MITSLQELRKFDGLGLAEHPPGFDEDAERGRFDQLTQQLEERFECTCEREAGFPYIQDASFLGWIAVPQATTPSGRGIYITVSNFGGLIVVLANDERDPSGANDTAEIVEAVEIAEALGYLPVLPSLLTATYDGNLGGAAYLYPDKRPTWWIRFFSWI